jgi:PAS domain S-box-containing protein
VEMREIGNARVYTLSRRVPLTTMLCFQKDNILIIDNTGMIVQVNDTYQKLCGRTHDDLLGSKVEGSGLPIIDDPELTSLIGRNHGPKEFMKQLHDEKLDIERFFKVRLIPSVFEGGQKGTTMIAEDITERTEYERRLEESEARYRAVVEDQNDLICRRLSDGTITFVNNAFARYFEEQPGDLLGTKFRPRVPEPDAHMVSDALGADIRFFKNNVYEQRIVLRNGEIRWIQWTNRVLSDESGDIIEIQSVGRDISAQRDREREILMNSCSIASSEYAIALWHWYGKIFYANKAFLSILGYTDELEVFWKPLEKFTQRVNNESNVNQIASSILTKGVWDGILQGIKKDGSLLDLKMFANILINDRYFPQYGGIGVFVPTSGERNPEPEQLIVQENINEKIPGAQSLLDVAELIRPSPLPAFITDRNKNVMAWNPAIEVLTGVKKEEIIGTTKYQNALEVYPELKPLLIDILETPAEEIEKQFPDVDHFGDTFYFERHIPSFRNQQGVYLLEKAGWIVDAVGNPVGILETIQDITETKLSFESLMHMKEEMDVSLNTKIIQITQRIEEKGFENSL